MKAGIKHTPGLFFGALFALVTGLAHQSYAQGGFNGLTVLPTGGGDPLVTATRTLSVDPSFTLPFLQFTFGFATDESVAPGQFADSFTVTLQDSSLATTMIFLTADASGVVWAPPTPGTVPIAPETISRTPVDFPTSVEPVLAQQFAYSVQTPLPSAFAGQTLSLHFDLFDNMNGVASLGWFSEVAVVPEPRLWMTGAVVMLVYLFRRKK
jgi:hypothetical protein